MEDIDLDSFIANIELTAPEDPLGAKLTCNECGGLLEEDEDGHYVCPHCSVLATDILQLDDTELHHDEHGRLLHGQRVLLEERKSKHSVDYGWSWSTDDAILHILKLQLDAMRSANLISDVFMDAVYNMWERFWLQSVAPYIKDEYSASELVQISARRALKLRDVEVLIKVQDKVMIPLHLLKGKKDIKTLHRTFGTQFFRSTGSNDSHDSDSEDDYDGDPPLNDNDDTTSLSSSVSMEADPCGPVNEQVDPDPAIDDISQRMEDQEEGVEVPPPPIENERGVGDNCQVPVDDLKDIAKHFKGQTKNLSTDSIEVLTVNRTLAFLEGTSRALRANDPLFASDIIRACNQRIIPFYGASRMLPPNIKFDQRDKLGFQKTRPPTPSQLTRTALLLLTNIYKDYLPKKLPVPNMDSIIERFTKDMNLPKALFEAIKGKVTFHDFRATRPHLLKVGGRIKRIPQYDRWAFAVLVIHLKIMFNLSDRQLIAQKNKALVIAGDDTAENYFIFHDWIRQLSLRLELIMRHDPFVLYHPMNDIERMVPTSQLAKYLEQIIEDREHAEITLHANSLYYDAEARKELADLLYREFPPPEDIAREFPPDEELYISKEVKYPISDAFRRTQQFWVHKLDSTSRELAFKSFTEKELVLVQNLPAWSIYDCGLTLKSSQLEISPEWPDALKLLLHVGAFLCFCEPVDLLKEVKVVEEIYHPQVRVIKRLNNARNRQALPAVLDNSSRRRTYGGRARNIRMPQ